MLRFVMYVLRTVLNTPFVEYVFFLAALADNEYMKVNEYYVHFLHDIRKIFGTFFFGKNPIYVSINRPSCYTFHIFESGIEPFFL